MLFGGAAKKKKDVCSSSMKPSKELCTSKPKRNLCVQFYAIVYAIEFAKQPLETLL